MDLLIIVLNALKIESELTVTVHQEPMHKPTLNFVQIATINVRAALVLAIIALFVQASEYHHQPAIAQPAFTKLKKINLASNANLNV